MTGRAPPGAMAVVATLLLASCGDGGTGEVSGSGVALVSSDQQATEVVVPADGRVGPVVEVSEADASVLLAVTTSDNLLAREVSISLFPNSVEPAGPNLPGQGIAGAAFCCPISAEPAWLFIPEANVGVYQLALSEKLAGSELTLELHLAVVPSRADLVGTWQYQSAPRFLELREGGEVAFGSTTSEQMRDTTEWQYTDGQLRIAPATDDGAEHVYAPTMLPDGQLAMATIGFEDPAPPEERPGMPTLSPLGAMLVLDPMAG